MAKRKKTNKRAPLKSGKNRSRISEHERVGGQLLPPFVAKLGDQVKETSWMNDRLPEMLWGALLLVSLGRDRALEEFRRILNFIGEHQQREQLHDLTLTGIAGLEADLRHKLIGFIVEPRDVAQALSALCLFDTLPGKEEWQAHLPQPGPGAELLMQAVGRMLWHQSQDATDCRWVRLMGRVIGGKITVPRNLVEEWSSYPEGYDQRKVRPSIRATEMILLPGETHESVWSKAFWQESWDKTPCIALEQPYILPEIGEGVTRLRIAEIRQQLEVHWADTHATTGIDAKHDAIFGMAFYCLRILEEMLSIGIRTSVLGRLGLRTILEVRINLGYLLKEDKVDLWKKWRSFGAGQAKLNALRFDESLEPPEHIDIDSIEQIATEDLWEEMLPVQLASWSGSDLRRLSERAGLKDTYDKYYSWASGYSHGMWGPVRESCYQTCGNPLHRLHRFPEKRTLHETVDDAAELVDAIMHLVDTAYPTFSPRLLTKDRVSSG